MRSEYGVTATIDKAEHIVLCDFVAKANAARTKNAALVVEGNARPKLDVFRFLHFVFQKTRTGRAVLDAELLKLAFAGLIADRTIERVID